MLFGDLILEFFRFIWEVLPFLIELTAIIALAGISLGLLRLALYGVALGLGWIVYRLFVLIPVCVGLAREQYLDFRRIFTIPPRRFGWQSLKGFADARTSLLAEPECPISLDTFTTSALCQECFRVVSQSRLISGSIRPLTRQAELHNWTLPLHVTELWEGACHLCRILWFSAASEIRDKVITDIRQGKHLQAQLKIWKGKPSDHDRYYIQLFYGEGQPDKWNKLSDPIPLQERDLNGLPPSATISMSTGSKGSIKLAKSWIENCRNNHTQYCRTEVSNLSKQILPKRLVYVGDAISSALHLVETRAVDMDLANIKYTALSYSRDDEISARQTLTVDKEDRWKTHINLTHLPLTFQHAVHLTRQLGLSFLWIDVLCILQDEVDQAEWRIESISVGSVYAHAYCTISACGSSTADGGCFARRTPSFHEFPCYLRFSKSKGLMVNSTPFDKDVFSSEVDKSTLGQQAWALQARLLSSRILHFGSHFIFFECSTHCASETVPQGKPYRKETGKLFRTLFRKKNDSAELNGDAFPSEYNPIDGYRAALNFLRDEKSKILSYDDILNLHWCWYTLLKKFTNSSMGQGSDRSIAILGLAQQIAASGSGLKYMHGLWSHHIILDLLWYIEPGRANRPEPQRAPTWSWQSVEGCFRIHLKTFSKEAEGKWWSVKLVAELINPETSETSDDRPESLSWVRTSESLTLSCPMLRGSNARNKLSGPSSLEIHTAHDSVRAEFWPDSVGFDESEEIFCAELIREVIREKKDKKTPPTVWSNGLVLHRTLERGPSGVTATYKRVGRFWMKWPVDVNDGAGESMKDVKPMFPKNKKQKVRII